MHPLAKLIIALLILLLFVVFVGVVWLDLLWLQALVFLLLSLLVSLRRGWRRWLKELKVMAPFTISLFVVYLLFGVIGVRTAAGERGDLPYWLGFGGSRTLVLLNSVLMLQGVFSFVNFDDILRLPVSLRYLKFIILGKLLYHSAFSSYSEICFQQSLIPSEQAEKKDFRHKFNARLASLLALLYFIISEARLKGELIDNRIKHCVAKENR